MKYLQNKCKMSGCSGTGSEDKEDIRLQYGRDVMTGVLLSCLD